MVRDSERVCEKRRATMRKTKNMVKSLVSTAELVAISIIAHRQFVPYSSFDVAPRLLLGAVFNNVDVCVLKIDDRSTTVGDYYRIRAWIDN